MGYYYGFKWKKMIFGDFIEIILNIKGNKILKRKMPKNNKHIIGFFCIRSKKCRECVIIFSGNAQKRMELHLKLKHGLKHVSKNNGECITTYNVLDCRQKMIFGGKN